MTNFSVNFTNAWWLLLLIPAVALTLISYFKLNKRYRCTRNRIVSISLHLVIMLLAIALLAGLTFDYYKPNTETEVILLVDSSFTTEDTVDSSDDFIKSIIDNCDSMYKLGIVKFGYDQVYAVELTNDLEKAYSTYLESKNPDTTATDLAAALQFAASKFQNPQTARIVLLTDALETDGTAKNVIKALAAKGISVDTAYFPGEKLENEVQIINAVGSVDKYEVNTPFEMNVTLQSSYTGTATISLYDNNAIKTSKQIDLVEGIQNVTLDCNFDWGGMHVVSFEIESSDDTLEQNNSYVNHIYIETFTEVLIIESIDNESSALLSALGEELNVKVVNVEDANNMPSNLDQLREFDEVILLNISNDDLPDGFDAILYEYVHNIGGGLFTVSGNEAGYTQDDWTANAYTREDMWGTLYQEMLPVEIVNYTAPVGVIIIVDTSGSMLGSPYESSPLYWAMQGAQACLDALTERDYIGIMTLADSYTEELSLTPRTHRDEILEIISELEESAIDGSITTGGTIFSASLERAGKALAARSDIEKKHIIVVSDCEVADNDREQYQYWATENAKMGVTMSIVGINSSDDARDNMHDLLVNYAGRKETDFLQYQGSDNEKISTAMRENLEVPEIKSVNYETFYPQINIYNSVTTGISQDDMPSLDGYYGVKLKPGADAVIMGNFTPIYSQWTFGKGRVGTFSCDLNGTWSAEFVSSETGMKLINNIIYALFPSENVRTPGVNATMVSENYTNHLSIFTELADGEYIKVSIFAPSDPEDLSSASQVITADKSTGYSRLSFPTKESGLHTIFIQRFDASNNEISNATLYRSMSYSKEYDAFADTDAAKELIEFLANVSDGVVLEDPLEVFDNAVEYLHFVIDPRVPFAILIIVLFLLDIAARKFKWKWIHEIIRDKKRVIRSK